MQTIEVDFEVFKVLTTMRKTESDTYNDVLRRLLTLGPSAEQPAVRNDSDSWITKGVVFPPGTEFRSRYKGEVYTARVESRGLNLKGQQFDSPSSAAVSITGKPTNGWTFWQARLPGSSQWVMIKSLRK